MHSVVYMPLLENALDTAVLVFATTQPNSYTDEHMEFLGNIASQVAHSFNKTIGMESLVISTVEGLAKLAESRDPETGDHLFRMSRYSALLAQQLGKTEPYRELIGSSYVRDILQFAPMHDIGKVGINDSVLLKPGRLDQLEREHMEQHPVIGGAVLRRCEQQMNAVGHSVFTIGIEIAESHHEKFDGSGYPNGLSGENIPLSARIVAAADVFDALTSKRPYKEAWPVDKALDLLNEQAGKHFDPQVINAMHAALPEIMQIYQQYKHI
jgi:response regulator RpfG family c-di-GMP phosphodiesterase